MFFRRFCVRGIRGGLVLPLAVVLCVAACLPGAAVEVVVHRGDNGNAPENTLAAAKRCVAIGVEYVEIDVRQSKDGVLYIMHDPKVDRTTDGTGFLRNLTSAEMDALDAGAWFSDEFRGEPVPRLEAFVQWAKGKVKIYFDVKAADLEALAALVRRHEFESESFFWFGNRRMAHAFRALAPDLALKVNADTPEAVHEAKTDLDPEIIECAPESLTPEFIETCRGYGMRIMVREGQPDEEAFRRTVEAGADLINLDHPELFARVQAAVLGKTSTSLK